MKIAMIADIHSNIYALEEVIKDIKQKNIDLIICMGDLVGYCTYPNEVINLIRDNNILTIMGNYDDAVGYERLVCGCDYPDPRDIENAGISLNWAIDNVTEENKKFLRELPRQMLLTFEEKKIQFVHGSPRVINEYLKENSKISAEVMEKFEYDILVCGHTHVPYYKMYGEKILINCGSAGKPMAGKPLSNYAVMDITKDDVKVEIFEVSYDFEKTAKAIEDNDLPVEFAQIIRTGKAH